MTGYWPFLRKELTEIVRTWRLWVLPGLLLFFAVTSPPMARYSKELLRSMLGDQADALPPIPDPTYLDAYGGWVKNIGQLGLLTVIIVFGGIIASEVKSQQAVLLLSKPVSRWSYVLAKVTAASLLLTAATALGTLATYIVTRLLFHDAEVAPLLKADGAWLLQALLLLALVTALSTVLRSSAAVSGIGVAAVFVLALLGIWGPAARRSPTGIGALVNEFAMGHHPAWQWPVATTILAIALLVALAGWLFQRREL